jgi:hypothetical protein
MWTNSFAWGGSSVRARPSRRRIGALALGLCCGLLAACQDAEGLRTAQTRTALVGTWLAESEEAGGSMRRVLVLGNEGKFSERISVASTGAPVARKEFAGEWSYDGTHLKRRYLQEDGRQFAGGRIRYATFPLVFVSAEAFVVRDTIVAREVNFRRAAEGTQP